MSFYDGFIQKEIFKTLLTESNNNTMKIFDNVKSQ